MSFPNSKSNALLNEDPDFDYVHYDKANREEKEAQSIEEMKKGECYIEKSAYELICTSKTMFMPLRISSQNR